MAFDMDWLVKNYSGFFENFGIDQTELVNHFSVWKEESSDNSIKDYLWYLFHVLIGETKKQLSNPGDYHRNLHEIYLKMLEFRVNVEGDSGNQLIQLIMVNKILQWKAELPYKFHLQAISLDCCPHCESINGQEFEPEQVLRNPHFASKDCTKESGCSCGYIPISAPQKSNLQ